MEVYKITEEAYEECGKVLTLISDLEEYFPAVDRLISESKDPDQHNSIAIMIDFIENYGDNALYPANSGPYRKSNRSNGPGVRMPKPDDILTLTPKLLLETYKQETLDMLVKEEYLELEDVINSFIEQVELNMTEGNQGVITATISALADFDISEEDAMKEIRDIRDMDERLKNNIIWVIESRLRLINVLDALPAFLKLPISKAVKPLNLNHKR